MSILTGNSIKLRALEPSDIDKLYKWENDSNIWPVSNTLVPFSRFLLEKYIADSHMDIFQAKQLRLMIDYVESDTTDTIGAIDLYDFDPMHKRAGIGILISDEKYRNRGYATEALELLINYSFKILQLHQLFCHIDSDNKVSIRLFEKFRFKVTGEKKDWNKTPEGWKSVYMLQLINPLN
ncbi:MAG: GNAT family N-acetyltransferase [Bacteroidales bacterium]